jgi:invasin B
MATKKTIAAPVKKAAPKKAAKKAAPKKAIKSKEADLNVILTEEKVKDVLDEVTYLTVELDQERTKSQELSAENSILSQKAFRLESEVNDHRIEHTSTKNQLDNMTTLQETGERMRQLLANQNDTLIKEKEEIDNLYRNAVNRIDSLELILDAKQIEMEELKQQFDQVNAMLDRSFLDNTALKKANTDLESKWYHRLFRKLS